MKDMFPELIISVSTATKARPHPLPVHTVETRLQHTGHVNGCVRVALLPYLHPCSTFDERKKKNQYKRVKVVIVASIQRL